MPDNSVKYIFELTTQGILEYFYCLIDKNILKNTHNQKNKHRRKGFTLFNKTFFKIDLLHNLESVSTLFIQILAALVPLNDKILILCFLK